MSDHPPREQKFYGRRKGRLLRVNKSRLMENLLPSVVINLHEERSVHPSEFFKDSTASYQDYCLEIGFGGGEHLAAWAAKYPERGFIGCEAFVNGVASLLEHIDLNNIQNVRIYPKPVQDLLKALDHQTIRQAFVMFPDPWPKAKHQKRRLVNAQFLKQLSSIMHPEGILHMASDDIDYIGAMLEALNQTPQMNLISHDLIRPDNWPATRYEQKALQQGKTCHYLTVTLLSKA